MRRCSGQGRPRDSTTRRLAHEPFGWRPTILLVTVRWYRCESCGHVWRQDTSAATEPRARQSRCGLRWALTAVVCQHLMVARIAEGLGVSWNTANDEVLAEGRRVLIADPHRFDGSRSSASTNTCGGIPAAATSSSPSSSTSRRSVTGPDRRGCWTWWPSVAPRQSTPRHGGIFSVTSAGSCRSRSCSSWRPWGEVASDPVQMADGLPGQHGPTVVGHRPWTR